MPDVEAEMATGKTGAIVGGLVALLLTPLPAPKPDTEKGDGEGAD